MMKQLGLLTTIFLFTISLAVYSRNVPVTFISLRNRVVALFPHSPNSPQNRFQRSLDGVWEKTKSNPFSSMTKDPD